MGLHRPVLFIAFLAWISYRLFVVFRVLITFGFAMPVFSHSPGPCKIFYVNGSEDIDVLPSGLAVISSGLKYSLGPHKHDPAMKSFKGIIYGFDFNSPGQVLKEFTLQNFDSSDFVPHGIDAYIDPNTKEISLFVVNHGGGKQSIEIFQLDQEQLVLRHKKTVTDENIYFPNDVVAVGPDSFYITNDHYFSNELLSLIEVFYPLKYGNVVFYNGTAGSIAVAAGSMVMPNGINIDKTGKYVFISDVLGGKIVVFKRKDDNSLEQHQEIVVGAPLDNIFVDEVGNLWSGSTSIAMIEYSKNFSNPCPAKAYQVKLVRGNNGESAFKVEDIMEVYSTKGDGDLKAATSAVFYRGKLLIGTVFGNLMYCDVVIAT